MIGKVYLNDSESFAEYGLLLASKSVSAPKPRFNFINVPGRDGLIDASDSLTGEVTYEDREILLTLIGVDTLHKKTWSEVVTKVSNNLHGKKVKIFFPEDQDHYYLGRCSVDEVSVTPPKETFVLNVQCYPYKLKNSTTVVEGNLTTNPIDIVLQNEFRPVVPIITVSGETKIVFNAKTTTLSQGSHKNLDIRFVAGENTLTASCTSGEGTIKIEYQEGEL